MDIQIFGTYLICDFRELTWVMSQKIDNDLEADVSG
jgi:hypothetical protein